MKKLFKEYREVCKLLKQTEADIKNLATLPYYKAFGREKEMSADLSVLENERQILMSRKVDLLDKIEDAASVEKRETEKLNHVPAA